MKAAPVQYARAATLDDVFRLQRESGGTAKLLAGGQSLLAALAYRLMEPSLLIDITHGTEAVHDQVPTELSVPALSTKTTTITFATRGELVYTCHLPGHEEYGMTGTLRTT